MEVSKTYDPAKAEDKWYAKWIEADYLNQNLTIEILTL